MSAHRDDLKLEDAPSRNVAAREPWWRPRHVRMRGCRTWPTPPWCAFPCRPGGICAP